MGSFERRRNQPRHKMMKMTSDDILISILSRTPARSVIRFRCVSKHWFSLTHEPYFLHMHLRNSPDQQRRHPCIVVKEFDSYVDIHNVRSCGDDGCNSNTTLRLYSLGDNETCTLTRTMATKCFYRLLPTTFNGLICLASNTDAIVLNPTTNESVTITLPDGGNHRRPVITFVFDPVSRKYKLIWVVWQKGNHLQVFTVGSSESWRSVGVIPFPMDISTTCVVSGVMYWLSIYPSTNDRHEIAAFDLGDEQLRWVEPPSCRWDSHEIHYDVLHEWDGKLCFLCYCGFKDGIDVWVLTRNHWVKMYSICLPPFLHYGLVTLIWMSEENALLNCGRGELCYYYFKTKMWRFIYDFEATTTTTINAYLRTLTPIPLSSTCKEVVV